MDKKKLFTILICNLFGLKKILAKAIKMGKIIILNALRPVIIFPEILNKWPKERRCMESNCRI
jgi:TM2 domain-containing membrane protein YozV